MLFADVAAARSTRRRNRPRQNGTASMTETDILAMPADEYMGSVQIAFFKARLLALELALVTHARRCDAVIAECGAVADPVDRASSEEEHVFALSSRARNAAQLLAVKAALQRIEDGQYGYCLESGESIGVQRLLACPTCVLTVESQIGRASCRERV